MGLFSDRCQALVDPQTGKALTGEALQKAKQDPKSKRCRNKVKKTAKFCNKCGSPAPGGWIKCPSCGKWVGNESQFCWNCDTPLHPESRAAMAGGRWRQAAGSFAQRFEVGDIKKILTDGLIVEEGTKALLVDAGKYKDVLEPGSHNVDSLARRINHWGSPPPRSVVLVQSGEVILPLRIEGLRSAEEIEVRYYGEVIIQFNDQQARDFLSNLFKDRELLSIEEVAERFLGEIRHAIEAFCVSSTIEDIVKDPQRRLRLEDSLRETLEASAKSWGIEVIRVSTAEFYGRAYEELRAKAGELEVQRREFEFEQRLRELVSSDKMGQFKSEHDLEEYVAQLAQERGVSDLRRDHELTRLKQVHRHELEAAELAHQMDQELEEATHKLDLRKQEDNYERDKLVQDTQAKVQAAEAALELKRKKKEIQREDLREKADILEGRDITTLIGLIDDSDKRAQLLEIHKRTELKGGSPEEILALTADSSPELAQALVDIMANRRSEKEDSLEEIKNLTQNQADQLERILNKTLESVAEATKRPGSSTNIHK